MISAFWDLPDESCRLNGPPRCFLWDYERGVAILSNLLNLSASVNTWVCCSFPTYTCTLSDIYETVAEVNVWATSWDRLVVCFIFSLLTFFTASCISLTEMLIKKDCVFSRLCYVCAGCICKIFLPPGHFLILFSFWHCTLLHVLFLLCYCFELCLPYCFRSFLFFLVFWIASHAKILSFVISLILLDNFFQLANFSLLYQGSILIIINIFSLFCIFADPNYYLIFIRNFCSLCKLQDCLF